MFLFGKRKKTNAQPKVRKDSPEIIAAREYLERMHPTLLPRDGGWNKPFNCIGISQNGQYTRYHFCEGLDKRIIYIVLQNEEREKVIQVFEEKVKEQVPNCKKEFIYKDSLKGMFIGEEVKHRFYTTGTGRRLLAFMSDDGNIQFPPIIESENMD